jgi:lipopolysaccharide export system ATP-binding protein
MSLLTASHLSKSYNKRTVVNDVSLTVNRGEIVGLLGPNGAGKTTSFYMIAGLVQPDQGTVTIDGNDVTRLPMHRRARLGLGYLPQEESIFRNLLNRSQRRERTEQLLERFGITKLAKSLAITLSGGEKRRLSIARSLCTDPKIIMLDEPFAGVDPLAVEDIQRIVRELREQDNLAILITDHSVRETLSIVDRAFLIHDGRVILQGTSEEIVNNPIARQNYLGENFRF